MEKVITSLLTALILLMCFTSCEEDSKIYENKVLNACYMDILNTGIPFLKINIDEVQFNEKVVATDIAAPSYDGGRTESEYFNVETGVDYEVSITFTTIFYDSATLTWDTEGAITETYVAGTETWSNDDDHTMFGMKFTCGSLLNAYRPVFETFYVE